MPQNRHSNKNFKIFKAYPFFTRLTAPHDAHKRSKTISLFKMHCTQIKKNNYLRLIIDIKTDLAKKWTGKGGNYSFVCLFIKVRSVSPGFKYYFTDGCCNLSISNDGKNFLQSINCFLFIPILSLFFFR